MKITCAARALSLGFVAAVATQLRTNVDEATVKNPWSGPRPHTVALGFHGEYYRSRPWSDEHKETRCSDYFQSEDSISKNIIKPLEDAGIEVRIYFHTYFGACSQMDSKLVGSFGNKLRNHTFTSFLPRIVDSYLNVVHMIADDLDREDDGAILLLRFDVQYKVPITSLNVAWDKINFAHRDMQFNWDNCRMASDLFFIFPRRHVDPFVQAIEWSGNNANSAGYCCHGANPHFVYDPLSQSVGAENLTFLQEGFSSSQPRQDMVPDVRKAATPNMFLEISRACSTSTEC